MSKIDIKTLNEQMPSEFFLQYFYLHSGAPVPMSNRRMYRASCPICREGNSWLKKKRLYYNTSNNLLFCHNCGWSGTAIMWLHEVTGLSIDDIAREIKDNVYSADILIDETSNTSNTYSSISPETLPRDSINLNDTHQLSYYKDNRIIQEALNYLKHRFIDISCNRPKSFYISLTDRIHKNRLIIPFHDTNKKIIFYQSRSFLPSDHSPKYLSKINGDRSIFNIENVTSDIGNVYIFEGPLNSCFVKNGVAIAGITEKGEFTLTETQEKQKRTLFAYRLVWVLDSQWIDNTAYLKTISLIDQDQYVFIWPRNIGNQFKDFNDIAMHLQTGIIRSSFIDEHTYKGTIAKTKIGLIGNQR